MHLIMFDIDGTLVESTAFDAECYKNAVEQVLKINMSEDWSAYKNVTDTCILQELLDTHNIQAALETVIEPIKARFFSAIEKHLKSNGLKEISGASSYLNSLKLRKNIQLAMATGGWLKSAEMKLRAAGIDITGIPSASSDDHHTRIGIMQHAEKLTKNKNYKSRIYFGDGVWDKKACAELEYDFIAIGDAVEHDQKFIDFLSLKSDKTLDPTLHW